MSDVLKYGATAKWLHWLIAVPIILMLILAPGMEDQTIEQRQERVLVLTLHHQIHTALIMVIDRLERRVLTKTPGIDIGKWMLSTR